MNATLTCRNAREELGALVDGEAPAGVRDAVAGHLAECPACRAEADALREARRAVQALTVPELPADFAARTVARAQAALRERQGQRTWLRRLGDGLKRSGRFLLGPASPAPTAFGSFWRTALAGGMSLAGLALMSSYVLANAWCCLAADSRLVPRASYDAVRSFPLWNALVRLPTPWTILLVSLPLGSMALLGARILRPGALLEAFRAKRPLAWGSVAAFALGALALVTFVGVFLVGVVQIVTVGFGVYPRYDLLNEALPWMVRGAIGAVAVGSLALLAARSTRGVTALAVAFYAVLACAFIADQAVATTTTVLSEVQANLEHVAVTVAGASPRTLWQAVLALPALGGFFMGVLLSLLAWRTARRGVLLPGGVLAMALAATLLLGGWEVRHHLETRWQLGQSLQRAAGLTLRPASARSALVLFDGSFDVPGNGRLALVPARGTRMPAVYRYPVPWKVLGGNERRLETFLAEHPHSLLAADAYRALIQDACAQWDDTRMLGLRLRFVESRPWEATELLLGMTDSAPAPQRLAVARALADPARFVAADPQVRGWLAEALRRQGDPNAKPHDGEVTGRLALNGRPLAGAPIRLVSMRDRYPTDHRHPPISRLIQVAADSLSSPPAWRGIDNLCVTRTDGQGRFHFRGLQDATYVPAVLIYADLSGWSGRVKGASGLVTITPGHSRVDMGVIHLTLRPGAAEAVP